MYKEHISVDEPLGFFSCEPSSAFLNLMPYQLNAEKATKPEIF